MSRPNSNRQFGLSRLRLVLLLALVAITVAAGGWWWTQRPASGGLSAAGAQGAPGANPAAGGASAPGGSGRRFGGANRVQPVTVAAVRKQDIRVVQAAIGNIAALNTAVVRARVDGELKAIRFKEGQQVRAGQLLAEIDPRSYEVALAQAQGQFARDQAQLRNAQLDLERYKELLAKDSIARQQVDTQEALVRQLQGTVQVDQAQVDNARLQLSYTKVTAPISGRLGLKQADLGNIIRSGDAAGLVSITQTQPISVVFAVPEANLTQITRQLKANTPLVVEAWDREQRNRLATGKVSTTDNAIDPVTGTIKLKAEFANADGNLFPNQFTNIRLQLDMLEGVLSVPNSAVQRGAIGTFVYVVKEDGSVTVRRIRVGTVDGEWVSVQGELAPGDKVVTDGADRLREGAKVEVITPPTRQAGPGEGGGRRRDAAAGAGAGAGAAASAAVPAPGASAPAVAASRAGRPGATPAAPAASAAGDAKPSSAAWIDQLPPEAAERVRRTMERLPPDVAQKVNAMSPDERRAFFQKLREQRRQQEGQ
ncbi:MAG TPA: MdtA/MuxA family multidrug efflux RND transporter periplasmic adaptor subunit [Burkholderiaceae bacterium]|nr:MdtA/MuxA family multidrug efflux RND transporter periplasmic adaptor subunit [Burkholderiaceae bacterium]